MNLGAVERNCRHLASLLTGGGALCAVVKADGYGHGAVPCAKAALAGGASWLAVATGPEAAELRAAGLDGRILVMGALMGAELEAALDARADVVAWSGDFVTALADRAAAVTDPAGAGDRPVGVHVKLDTGMGRLGTLDPDEARALCDRVAEAPGIELAGVMTHFATADEPGDDHFEAQLQAFTSFAAEVKRAHPGVVAHAANSAAVYRDKAAHFDMARCGIAIYGLDPFHEDPGARGLEPALSLESYVAAVKPFEIGRSAGYGRRWRAPQPTSIGVLPIGYGDGWRRGLTNNAEVLVGGRRRPLVGTVSMDNVTVDLGPEPDVKPGAPAVLIGEQDGERIWCEEVAARLDTINYEITCGIGPRVPRRYVR